MSLTDRTERPRIYVACLAAYNSGILHGEWIDAAQEPWTIWDAVQIMLAASPVAGAEEWAIHGHEGFGRVHIDESEAFDRVSELATFIADHGAIGAALLDYVDDDLDKARAAMAHRYLGAYASLADYVQEVTEEAVVIPAPLRHYIDWQAMARDAEIDGDVFTITAAWDVVHVFAAP